MRIKIHEQLEKLGFKQFANGIYVLDIYPENSRRLPLISIRVSVGNNVGIFVQLPETFLKLRSRYEFEIDETDKLNDLENIISELVSDILRRYHLMIMKDYRQTVNWVRNERNT